MMAMRAAPLPLCIDIVRFGLVQSENITYVRRIEAPTAEMGFGAVLP